MRLALIRQRYTPFGGAERFVANAVNALENEAAEITLITRAWGTNGDQSRRICDPFYLGNVWRDWGFARCVCRLIEREQFDLVQSHERIACCDVYRAGDGVHREWLTQRRRALGPAGRLGLMLNPYHRYILGAEERLFSSQRLKAVICNSAMVKEEILHYFHVDPAKLHIVYNGVDLNTFHPGLRAAHRVDVRRGLEIPPEATVFLFVGSGYERKGLATALRALAKQPKGKVLMVAGKDKRESQYHQLAAELGITRQVRFLGPQSDVTPFYGAADAFVLPTLYDPFPNAAMEAFASGLPVVTSTKSGAAEFVREGVNGYVRDALDIQGWADVLGRLAGQDDLKAMGAAAREAVADMSFDAMGMQLAALYRALLGGKQA